LVALGGSSGHQVAAVENAGAFALRSFVNDAQNLDVVPTYGHAGQPTAPLSVGIVAGRKRELHPEWFEDGRRQFEQVCQLLDLIGWDVSAPTADVQVPGEHAQTLREAIEGYLPLVEQWLPEAKALRTRREHRDSVQAMCSLLAALRQLTPADGREAS
jgi:hypothetical protein